MARVTVEDCLDNVDNRFQLVLVATKRARQIAMGKEPMVDWENDKPTVVALREIAEGYITRTILDEVEQEPVAEPLPGIGMSAGAAEETTQASDEIIETSVENPSLKGEDE